MDEKTKQKLIKASLISSIGCSPLFLGIIATFLAVFFVLGLFDIQTNENSSSWGSLTNGECGFTINATSLTKKEFKEKIQEFVDKQNLPDMQIFADNADDIYDLAVAKNLNPELVVIRAWMETGGVYKSSYGAYNYWGYGNYNGSGGGVNFSSFEQGYTAYLDNISQYDSLFSMMMSYAYIGKYWYNPGNWDIGGCAYHTYMYTEEDMPARVKNACSASAPTCTNLNGGPGCVETTTEDQEAYARFQVKAMGERRKTIFGLEANEGVIKNTSSSSYTSISNPNTFEPNWNNKNAWYTTNDGGLNPYNGWIGQCTWFAWGTMYQIYNYSFNVMADGESWVSTLIQNHGDLFESSSVPAAGGVFSIEGCGCNHVGVVLSYDPTTKKITYIDGNYDGVNNTYETAKKDWGRDSRTAHEIQVAQQQYRGSSCLPNITFAAPKGGVETVRKKLNGDSTTENTGNSGTSDQNICVPNYGNNITLKDYPINGQVDGKTLEKLNRKLTSQEINDLNKYLDSEIKKAGYGTGSGVAAAGQALTYWLAQKGYRLSYYWGGGHAGFGDHNYTFTKANENWGSRQVTDQYGNTNLGMDCSGFVSWAIRTACYEDYGSLTAYYMNHGPSISISETKPGDLMLDRDKHVRMIVKNNGDGTVITTEETGNGLIFMKYTTDPAYEFISMSDYYKKTCNKK